MLGMLDPPRVAAQWRKVILVGIAPWGAPRHLKYFEKSVVGFDALWGLVRWNPITGIANCPRGVRDVKWCGAIFCTALSVNETLAGNR